MLRHSITEHFYGWIAYTLSRSEVAGTLAEGVPMGMNGMPRNGADLSWRPGPFDQTHNLILVASYRFRDWETGASYRLVTGTPRTPVAGSFLDADFGTYTRENGPPGSARNAIFSQLDVRVERRFTFDHWVLGVYLDCINVLNSENAGGRAVRLSLAAVGAAARGADPADPRREGTLLMRARRLAGLIALAAVAALACTNFQDPTTVVDLRMLAVQVEPSEIILDADLSDPSMPVVDPPTTRP